MVFFFNFTDHVILFTWHIYNDNNEHSSVYRPASYNFEKDQSFRIPGKADTNVAVD